MSLSYEHSKQAGTDRDIDWRLPQAVPLLDTAILEHFFKCADAFLQDLTLEIGTRLFRLEALEESWWERCV